MDLTDAIKEAYEYAPGDVVYYDTLEIDHTSFTESLKVVRGYREMTFDEGTFIPVMFTFSLPETAGSVRGQMQITIHGISRAVRAAIRYAASTTSPISVTYRQYINTTTSPDAELPVPLQVVSIRETFAGIEATAMLPDLVNALFPRRLMTWANLFAYEA